MPSRGLDISAWQDTPDIAALKRRHGLTWIAVKATEGAHLVDPDFAANWAHAKAAGLVRVAYHFARPEQSSAAQQAAHFLAVVRPAAGDVLCLDLEKSALSQGETNAWAKAFAGEVRRLAPGLAVWLYMGSGYASNGTGRGLAVFYDRWWYPQYPSTARTSTWPQAVTPWLPDGLTCGWREPDIWQWTDRLDGRFDADITNLSPDELAASGGYLEDDMAEVVSVGATQAESTAPVQEIPANGDAAVRWTKAYSDQHDLFKEDSDGGAYSVVILPKDAGKLWAHAAGIFQLEGLQPGDRVEVAWDRMVAPAKDGDAWRVKDSAWRLLYAADKDGVIRAEIGGQFGLDPSVRLRLRVYNPNGYPVRLASAMAKVSLFKY